MWTRCDRDERPLLVASNPDAYRLTPHFEASPAFLLIWLEHIDEDEVRERLIDAWLIQAPKRLAAAARSSTRSYDAAATASSRGSRRETICETPSPPIVTP